MPSCSKQRELEPTVEPAAGSPQPAKPHSLRHPKDSNSRWKCRGAEPLGRAKRRKGNLTEFDYKLNLNLCMTSLNKQVIVSDQITL